ncbi:MAG: hypothetical protein ACR2PA_25385 [Hyphomicrobiaceae bacterium]
MKAIITTAAVVGLALGALSPVFAADQKKCDVGMEWDKTTQQCIKKQS